MTKIENLKKSLNALTVKNALLVKNLLQIESKQDEMNFRFENTQKGELNLFYATSPPFPLHDPKGALASETPWIQSFSPKKQVVFIFGSGLGYSYVLLKKWLSSNPSHHLVYIEPHLGVLFHLFQTEIGFQMATHPQVHFYTYGEKAELDYLLHYLAAYFTHLSAEVSALPSYQKAYPKLCAYYAQELTRSHSLLSKRIMESKASFSYAMSNALKKAPHLSGNIQGNKLVNEFNQIPCIIVGAGPSLKKNQELLKTLRQKAIILAGSSAIPAACHMGLEPHYGSYLDPYQRLHERLINTTFFEMPSFHSARTHLETSSSIHGPKLYLKGSDEFPYINWIEKELGFDGPLTKEYISVTTFNTCIALMLGCSPIIYVGVDLAYTENESYSLGVEASSHVEPTPSSEDQTRRLNPDVLSTDLYGQPILTKEGWKIESYFLSEIIKNYPSHQFINATQGGLGFQGAQNLTLQEVKERYLLNSHPIDEWSHSQCAHFVLEDPQIPKKCKSLFKELERSFKRVQGQYKKTLREIHRLEKENKKGKKDLIEEQFVFEAQVAISNEIAYHYLLTHQHQIIDTENLKTHSLYSFLPLEHTPKQKNEIYLHRLKMRFTSYLQASEALLPILQQAIQGLESNG